MSLVRPASLPRLADLRQIDLPMVSDGSEWLVALEDSRVSMTIRRVFSVHVDKAAHRGEHAHILCNQFLVCLTGRIEVVCDDGSHRSHVLLDTPGRGLFVPAGIWASQDYADSSTLMVLCDQPYDPADYLRVYQDFLTYRAKGEG
ncbi:FdtA/QdtA family cupin domain-containing protein [Magnetospirillum sp. SS-4]|uniref:sugar 3,4-ketoisomerase n=1 Tax=Magnetospirillum sp. SS-4 TaxID=2681465 RepID=UPI0013836A2D|nr:FdtA/QdtA family cupin domain-containing protein [Magnetospirillum sp. SS-4]CAA7617889.1 WxcM-like [Magnetospirillum sp. SS-4]